MPAVVVGRPKKEKEDMWEALKAHIIRERQRKKQEQEADAEVERQRKERERQQKQDVMTLGETREQISQLETRLAQLKDEKHQLFLQLKKVLNEDDRRRQLVKESSDMMSMHAYPAMALGGHPQIFLQQNIPLAGRAPIYKVAPPHGQHTLLPAGALKRTRTPSPPPSNYHQGYGYKPGTVPAYSQQKVDDGRRGHEYVRAVLWNTYMAPLHQPMEHSSQKGAAAFQTAQEAADKYYQVPSIRPATHVPIHGGAIPIQQPPQGAKTGSITSGYPIRAQPVSAQPQHNSSHVTSSSYQPGVSASHSVYVTQAQSNRLLYSQAGPPGHQAPPQNRYVTSMQREM
ncbi:G protein pathway suppressor 2 isoform X3 [Schistocerca gregaria]|uniref:G protein pathway suppressor 2 isoform X3 n=1 Tax=Schistocerca gregaria TaxID=7010 RepID=UPI00211F20D1|nr:G protein pathway suppressor 2 isoform X3 [Schistocerca gregaria]